MPGERHRLNRSCTRWPWRRAHPPPCRQSIAPPVARSARPWPLASRTVILCDEERRKGFVRPVRHSYVHAKCGAKTTMGQKLAETYARDPKFYSGTFCCKCGSHFPVGADGEFTWDGTSEKVGT